MLLVSLSQGVDGQQRRYLNLPLQHSPTAEDLLIRSYVVGRQLLPYERGFQLLRLIEVAKVVQPPLARLWCEELFDLTRDLPADQAADLQRNLLLEFASLNADRALELLPILQTPMIGKDHVAQHDARADSAVSIFSKVWDGHGSASLEELRSKARYLGETGEYPYAAMARIIEQLPRSSVQSSLLDDAFAYYRKGMATETKDENFADFLKLVYGVVPRAQLREMLELCVSANLNGRSPATTTFRSKMYTETGVAYFRDRKFQVLFGLLPVIRKLDESWAQRLTETYTELGQAGGGTGKILRLESVAIHGTPTPEAATALERRGLEKSRLGQIKEMASADPDEALRLAHSLDDPAIRSMAIAGVVPILSSVDANRVARLIEEIKRNYSEINEPRDKEDVLVAIAESQAAVGDIAAFRETMRVAFELGEELYQEDVDLHPQKPSFFNSALHGLSRLVITGTLVDTDNTTSTILHLQDMTLQSYLLVDMAEGLNRDQH